MCNIAHAVYAFFYLEVIITRFKINKKESKTKYMSQTRSLPSQLCWTGFIRRNLARKNRFLSHSPKWWKYSILTISYKSDFFRNIDDQLCVIRVCF